MERQDQFLNSSCAFYAAENDEENGTVFSNKNTEIKNLMQASILLREAILKCDEVLRISQTGSHHEFSLRTFPVRSDDLDMLRASDRSYKGQQGGAINNCL